MNASMADFHTIELIHSGITGRRQILFDDRPVISRVCPENFDLSSGQKLSCAFSHILL